MVESGSSERVERSEHKLDALSESVDRRCKEVDAQFLEVREHGEQRQYIEVIDSRSRPASAIRRRAHSSKRRR